MDAHTPEHRKSPRQRALLRGKLYFNNRLNVVDCLIRDISDCGARLIFSDAVTIPDQVELHIPQKAQTFFVTVAWRRGDEMGVGFARVPDVEHTPESGELAVRLAQLEKEVAGLKRIIKKLKADADPEAEVA